MGNVTKTLNVNIYISLPFPGFSLFFAFLVVCIVEVVSRARCVHSHEWAVKIQTVSRIKEKTLEMGSDFICSVSFQQQPFPKRWKVSLTPH